MRAIWKGGPSALGWVNIPIGLYPASRREELSFSTTSEERFESDQLQTRGGSGSKKRVPWEEIVKGFEHEKGQFVGGDR